MIWRGVFRVLQLDWFWTCLDIAFVWFCHTDLATLVPLWKQLRLKRQQYNPLFHEIAGFLTA